jgi:hypothetical protein
MKKLLLLSVLLGLLALPMFASDFEFGGDLTYGFIGDFGDDITETATVTFDVKATVGDYTSLVIEMDLLQVPIDLPDKAVVTTDIGGWLGLPVGLTANWGWDDPDANEFHSISEYDNEEVFDFSKGDYFGHQFMLSASFLEVEVAFNPGIADGAGPYYGALLAGVALKEPIPGLNAEVYYYQGGSAAAAAPEVDEYDLGQIMADAAYSAEFGGVGLDAGAAFFYNLDDTAAFAWAYGFAAAASVSMADITLGLNGDENDFLGSVSATVVVAPIDLADIYAGVWYDMVASELAEIDLGINAHIGATEMYVGYLVDGDSLVGAGDHFNAPPGLASAESGAYIKFDVDY